MSMNTNPGGDSVPRYNPNSIAPHQQQQDRRRRTKNPPGSFYSGPRDSRSYRDGGGRMPHRGSGGSGDGLHNGGGSSGYRTGGGNDYDQSQQGPQNDGHLRREHSHTSQYYHQYQQQNHQQYSHHSSSHPHQGGKGMDYDSTVHGGGRSHRSGGGSGSSSSFQHQSDHRSYNYNNSEQSYATGGGTAPPTSADTSQQQQQEYLHSPTGGGGVAAAATAAAHIGHFPGGAPQQIPGPPAAALSFFAYHPNTQPMFGSLALCHIPFGVNPSSVISPVVHTQIIGSGILTPGLPYNYPYALPVPAPLVPSHPVLIQQPPGHPIQQQSYQNPSHFTTSSPVGGMQTHPQQQACSEEDCMIFGDSSSILNPDADAFYPPTSIIQQNGDGVISPTELGGGALDASDIKSQEDPELHSDANDETGDGDLLEDTLEEGKKSTEDEVKEQEDDC